MNRMEFIKQCAAPCIGLLGIQTFINSCTPSKHIQAETVSGSVKIPKSEFVKGQSDRHHRYIIVRSASSTYPIVVYRRSSTEYRALLMRCTHQNNELNVNGDLLTCNAHGSEFNNEGKVIQGPAEEQLTSYPVSHDETHIYIRIA